MEYKLILSLFCTILILTACESEAKKKERLAKEEEQRIELIKKKKAEDTERLLQFKKDSIELAKHELEERIEREARLEKERREEAIYNKYINNSLKTGSTPYYKYYGGNSTCNDYGCSKIKVRTSDSDVIVTIKNNKNIVVRHAYINSGDSYTFSFPNGTYQTFFYYGKGWNPNKKMKGGEMKGGFITHENFSKDNPVDLNNNILEYELILQENGNFSTRPSNPEEAL